MKISIQTLFVALCLLTGVIHLHAQNSVVTYQGRVSSGGANFTGSGQFKFALVTSTNVSATATATAAINGGFVTSISATLGGSGYVTPPAVTISGGGGSGAAATANLSGGTVTSITVNNPGSGYSSAPTVTIAAPPENLSYTTFWSNDGTSNAGSQPTAAVMVPVSGGLFTARLGDTTVANMMALGAGLFTQPNLRLRIWFNDGVNGFAALNPTQPLTPAPYAIMATHLGTTGNQPLELTVNGTRALRLEATVNDADHAGIVNVVGGSSANSVGAGVIGATIGGGGAANLFGSSYINTVVGNFGTVSGGSRNTSGNYSATVGGGERNTSSGQYATVGGGVFNTSSAENATVGGGIFNTSSGENATVGGGGYNISGGYCGTVGGGLGNTNSGYGATVPGGVQNNAAGHLSFAAGNRAKANHDGALVWADSTEADFASTSSNQFLIRASGGVGLGVTSPQQQLSVATGMNIDQNEANSGTVANTLRFGSGSGESIGSKRTPGGNRWGLDFYTDSAHRMTILNSGNVGIGTIDPTEKLQVAGNILANGNLNFGAQTRQMLNLWGSQYGIGVQSSTTYFRTDSSAGVASGFAWYKGGAHNDGPQNAGGGTTMMRLEGAGLTVNGVFVSSSDRNAKENFAPVSPRDMLAKVAALPISHWNFKGDAATPHVGPMAQDFHAAFGLGTDDKHIATVDADGVALAAIQGLNQKVDAKELRIRELEEAVSELKQLVRDLSEKKEQAR